MPIYEFKCHACGFFDEVMGKMSDPSSTVCPKCRKLTFQKLISASSFQLTGSGWYATDFKNKKTETKKNEVKKTSKETTKENV